MDKLQITSNWLERYTNQKLEEFSPYVLITNFNNYVDIFCDYWKVERPDYNANMRVANGGGMTIINFGMGSPNAALIMDLLSAIHPTPCLSLGKCGAVSHKAQLGDFILPIAAIRGEGTSNDYFPPEVPALPAFMLERAVSSVLRDNAMDYWTGTVYTTNRRVWEHDERFKQQITDMRVMAVEMECATLFSCGFYNHVPIGALLLVSDNPMTPEGVKTMQSDRMVTAHFVENHVKMGIESLKMIIDGKKTVKHLKYDW